MFTEFRYTNTSDSSGLPGTCKPHRDLQVYRNPTHSPRISGFNINFNSSVGCYGHMVGNFKTSIGERQNHSCIQSQVLMTVGE